MSDYSQTHLAENDNCKMASTEFNLQNHEINNPKLYRIVDNLDDLKVGNHYRYAFTKSTYPECVQIVSNEGDILRFTYPGLKECVIHKSTIEPGKHIFYEKTSNALYPSRENYLNLAEGLSLTQARSPDPQSRYLFDDPNIMKEISTYQNNGGKKVKKVKKVKNQKNSKKRVIKGAKRKSTKKTSRR